MEMEMRPGKLIRTLTALGTLTAAGSAFAAAGYSHPTEGWVSSNKSRAEVQDELRIAKSRGLTSISMRDGDDSNIGARGPAGSRYSMRTREEVQSELRDSRNNRSPDITKDLYFGN